MSHTRAESLLESLMDLVTEAMSQDDPEDRCDDFDPHETIDAFMNTNVTEDDHVLILEAFGDRDLSEPLPDHHAGWPKLKRQLAHNALQAEVLARISAG